MSESPHLPRPLYPSCLQHPGLLPYFYWPISAVSSRDDFQLSGLISQPSCFDKTNLRNRQAVFYAGLNFRQASLISNASRQGCCRTKRTATPEYAAICTRQRDDCCVARIERSSSRLTQLTLTAGHMARYSKTNTNLAAESRAYAQQLSRQAK